MALILRTIKGSPLTYQEMDDNLTYLSSSLSQSMSASYALTASYAANVPVTASYATTASYALNGGSGAGFPFTGSAVITGSLAVTGSTSITGSLKVAGNITATGSLLLKSDDVNLSTTNTLLFIDNAQGANKVTSIDGIYKNASRAMIETNDRLGALDLTYVGTGNTGGFSRGLVIPITIPNNPVAGSMYFDAATTQKLFIYDGASWVQINP